MLVLPKRGDVVDGFVIDDALGEGGFAAVFRAHRAQSVVALKILKPDANDGYSHATIARFRRETAILAKLRAPTTVNLVDAGVTDAGLLWAAFELLQGEDLSELLAAEGVLAPDTVLSILLQVCESLGEAHRQGLLHRDIKPQNIRVIRRTADTVQVKLLDFGIARLEDNGHPSVTATGELVGTPRYMSPEQLKNQPLSAASDVYSLGLVAIELLCGAHALPTNRLRDQLSRLVAPHQFTPEQTAEIGEPLVSVVQRMTALDPTQRFATADAVARRLSRPGRHRREPDDETSSPATSTSKWVGLLLLFLLAIGVGVWLSQPEPAPAPVSVPHTRIAAPTRTHAQAPPEPSVDLGEAGPAVHSAPAADALRSAGCDDQPREGLQPFGDGLMFGPDVRSPRPLLVMLHPNSVRPEDYVENSDFVELAQKHQFAFIAPSAKTDRWSARVEDGAALAAAYEEARRSLCIDESRVFIVATGGSGRTARKFGCMPWVAAVAYYAVVFTTPEPMQCQRPTLFINPTQSTHLRIDGTKGCLTGSAKATLDACEQEVLRANGCRVEPTSVDETDEGTCRVFDCEAPSQTCRITGGLDWFGPLSKVACPDEPARSTFPVFQKAWEFFMSVRPIEPRAGESPPDGQKK